jgi:hypothetical protein
MRNLSLGSSVGAVDIYIRPVTDHLSTVGSGIAKLVIYYRVFDGQYHFEVELDSS